MKTRGEESAQRTSAEEQYAPEREREREREPAMRLVGVFAPATDHDRIEAKTDEQEHKAKVLAVDQTKGKVHVHFQGGRSKFDEWVPFKNVRAERQKQKADRAEQERRPTTLH